MRLAKFVRYGTIIKLLITHGKPLFNVHGLGVLHHRRHLSRDRLGCLQRKQDNDDDQLRTARPSVAKEDSIDRSERHEGSGAD